MFGEVGGSRMSNVLKAAEDMLKSPEQLEEEKQQKLDERIPKFYYEQMNHYQLVDTVEKLYKQLVSTTFMIYDLGERQQRQKYDMAELAERGRQLEKNKNKTRSKAEPTGLGGPIFTKLQEFFPQAPPKVSLFSRFERVIDRRTLAERREFFNSKHQFQLDENCQTTQVKKQSKYVVQTEKNLKKKPRVRKPVEMIETTDETKQDTKTDESEQEKDNIIREDIEKVDYKNNDEKSHVKEEELEELIQDDIKQIDESEDDLPKTSQFEEEEQEITHHEKDETESVELEDLEKQDLLEKEQVDATVTVTAIADADANPDDATTDVTDPLIVEVEIEEKQEQQEEKKQEQFEEVVEDDEDKKRTISEEEYSREEEESEKKEKDNLYEHLVTGYINRLSLLQADESYE